MAKARYWDGPEGSHRSYCEAVEELFISFMRERKLVPETTTPDHARDMLKAIRETGDPRIRDFNQTMRMLRGPPQADAAGSETSGPGNAVHHAHQLVGRSLHDKATEVLNAFGNKDYRRGDYWIVDDD